RPSGPQLYGLPKLKAVTIRIDALQFLPGGPQIGRSTVRGAKVFNRSFGLQIVGRLNHRHARKSPHHADVLQTLLGIAIVAHSNPSVTADDPDVGTGVADRDAKRIKPPGNETRKRANEGELSGERQSRACPDHVRFGNAHFKEARWKLLGEDLRLGALR